MAGSVSVTAKIQTILGDNLQGNAFVRFKLRNFSGFVPRVNGVSVISEPVQDVFPDASGNISTTLWGNDVITPSNTFYTVEWWDAGRIVSSGNYVFNGSSADLDSQDQVSPPPGPPSPFLIEVNGIAALSQKVLNLVQGTNVVITDGVGGITFSSSGGGGGGAGMGQQTVTFSSTPVFAPLSQIAILTLTLSADVTSSTFSAAGIISPALILMQLIQDGSGGHAFVYPPNFLNAGSIGTTANQTTFQLFYWDGTDCWAISVPTVFP